MQQPVRAHDVEFCLLLQPRGGWVNKTKLVLESLGVLVASGLICLLVNLLESRRAVELALADANHRLARETEDRKRTQDDYRAAKDEGAAAQAELGRTRSALQSSTELEIKLNGSVHAAETAAQAVQAELDQSRMALQQAEQTITNLQSRLRAAARAQQESKEALPTPPQVEQPSIADAPVTLDAAAPVVEQSAEPSPASVSAAQEARQEPSAPFGVDTAAPSDQTFVPETLPAPAATPEAPGCQRGR